MAEESQQKQEQEQKSTFEQQEEEQKQQEPATSAVSGDPAEQQQQHEPTATEADIEAAMPTQSASFKEESNVVADLPDPEKKALDELKQLVKSALEKNEFNPPPPPPPPVDTAAEKMKNLENKPERVTLADELTKPEETKKTEEEEQEQEKQPIAGEESKSEEKEKELKIAEEGEEKKESSIDPVMDKEEEEEEEKSLAAEESELPVSTVPVVVEQESPKPAEEVKKEESLIVPAVEEVKKEESFTSPVKEEELPKPEEAKLEEFVDAQPPVEGLEEVRKEEIFTAPATEEGKKEEFVDTQVPESSDELKKEETFTSQAMKEGEKEESGAQVPPCAEEKLIVIEDDGAKTLEMIEESVVPVSATPLATETAAAEPHAQEVVEDNSSSAGTTPAEEFIWGVPLLGDEKSDTVLLKFLRARDFKVKDAFTMLKNTMIWRKLFGIESLLEEDLGLPEMNKVVFMHGQDKEGHPVCYNVFGEFQDKDLYAKAFGDEERRQKFMRWRIQFLEKGIRQQLDFTPGAVCTMVQINDLKNSPGAKRELRQTTNQALTMLQDNYPEFVAKQVFINVPWWYLAYNRMISPFLTQRTKSKFVFASPSKSAETLFKYIAPEQVPVRYGGLSKEDNPDFTIADAATDITIKPSGKHVIDIPVAEPSDLVWELRVLGWDVTYGAEFVPTAENGYTVIIQKARKFTSTDEPVLRNTFKIGEPGKIVLSIDNTNSKKKKVLYRSKAKSSSEAV